MICRALIGSSKQKGKLDQLHTQAVVALPEWSRLLCHTRNGCGFRFWLDVNKEGVLVCQSSHFLCQQHKRAIIDGRLRPPINSFEHMPMVNQFFPPQSTRTLSAKQ